MENKAVYTPPGKIQGFGGRSQLGMIETGSRGDECKSFIFCDTVLGMSLG